ncbi:L,D-transpeptidase family protein [Ferrimonas lipolytica]|uniref:L,D-transpeptidase family protein n=1 Tax=Ferrimonas lipolytica TaxID=2724191 RepID=A0A6H1UA26_9GAMM|nr:L,D-transpeptidase family protein [Ferrimonas lipolytica]QIZ75905.1 L,D-transpeptidase family protein [Ferrimonas lipolytica]
MTLNVAVVVSLWNTARRFQGDLSLRSKLLPALAPLLLLLLPCSSIGKARTVDSVITAYGPDARARLAPYFTRLPKNFRAIGAKLVALKEQRSLEIWLQGTNNDWHHLRDYPIKRASGTLRPKMRQGDLLVPEGVYRLDAANPNSKFHLSLRIDYPNSVDRFYAEQEQRGDLGGDIFIHGREVSTGCLAMGDQSIEELFVLAHDIGLENIEVVITPKDPRLGIIERPRDLPTWVEVKYENIERSVAELQANNQHRWY